MNNTTRAKTSNTVKNRPVSKTNTNTGLLQWITQYDSLVVFGGFGLVICLTVLYTGLFQAGPMYRSSVVFNAAMGILMAFGFMYIIYTFMGEKINIWGKSFDIGMVIYIFIVCFVIFVFGN